MDQRQTRRAVLRTGAIAAGVGIAGCSSLGGDDPLFSEGFESDLEGWETAASIGPEEPVEAFEWSIERSEAVAAEGDWSLEVFTEGDHDDGTAWATTELETPDDTEAFEVTLQAWSQSESFNILRGLVAYLGPTAPEDESDFPEPGMNSSEIPDAPVGGLREPLHLAEGWREYSFRWEPADVPDRLFLSVGVSVVWESAATHYLDEITVTAE